MSPHLLTNFEIQKHYQNDPRFNCAYSKDNLTKIKDGAYIIKLDEYYDIGTHWAAFYISNDDVTYFDSSGVEHTRKEIITFTNLPLSFVLCPPLPNAWQNKNIKTNIFRTQAYDSIVCGYFCIGFISVMLAWKTLTKLKNIFSPNNFKKNDNIILNYFMK